MTTSQYDLQINQTAADMHVYQHCCIIFDKKFTTHFQLTFTFSKLEQQHQRKDLQGLKITTKTKVNCCRTLDRLEQTLHLTTSLQRTTAKAASKNLRQHRYFQHRYFFNSDFSSGNLTFDSFNNTAFLGTMQKIGECNYVFTYTNCNKSHHRFWEPCLALCGEYYLSRVLLFPSYFPQCFYLFVLQSTPSSNFQQSV